MITLITNGGIAHVMRRYLRFSPHCTMVSSRTDTGLLGAVLRRRNDHARILDKRRTTYSVTTLRSISRIVTTVINTTKLLPALTTVHTNGAVLLTGGRSLIAYKHLFVSTMGRDGTRLLPISDRRGTVFRDLPRPVRRGLKCTSLRRGNIISVLLAKSNNPFHRAPLHSLTAVAPSRTYHRPG